MHAPSPSSPASPRARSRAIAIGLLTVGALLVAATPARPASPTLDDLALLPAGTTYDPSVPRPEQALGWPVGTWHVRHDQLVRYFEVLAETSERVTLTETGRTWEDRPLLLATITSPDNHARLEQIRAEHLRGAELGERSEGPVVAWLGYSIHGNESSGSNAALLVAYHLAAAQGDEVERLLRDVVVLLDPSQNPDGLARFASWVNTHKGKQLVADASSREHVEVWPGGRSNHYWADLNRDWLLLTHPESRARIAQFQRWRPNVLTDHHEMGTDSTFFFQPGVPSRTNPLTSPRNQELTGAIAAFHAEALDAQGRLYYSGESFDDFYYGKGSTYPDVQGAIGILFEQASSRGHLQENAWGPLPFVETIRNHVTASLSSLRATLALEDALLDFQAEQARQALAADDDPRGAWLLGDDGDPVRAARMLDVLLRHRITVCELTSPIEREGTRFIPGQAWIVPLRQPQGRLARAALERVTTFPDDVFYDVSTWTLPLAFGLPCVELPRGESDALQGARLAEAPSVAARAPTSDSASTRGAATVETSPPARAWLLEWTSAAAPRALAHLLAAGVLAGVATRPLAADTLVGAGHDDASDAPSPVRIAFAPGTIVVPAGVQTVARAELEALLAEAAREGVVVHATATGLTAEGIDLGSPSVRPLAMPKVVLLTGAGVSSSEAGEAWLQLDQRWDVPVMLLDLDRLASYDLHDTTHVLAMGAGEPSDAALEKLDAWVRAGGVLVGTTRATRWVGSRVLGESAARKGPSDESRPAPPAGADDAPPVAARPTYADAEQERAKGLVAGAFFEAELDLTHPLAFGFTDDRVALFKSSTSVLAPADDAVTNVALFSDAPRLSGYASDANIRKLAGTAAVIAQRRGAGAVVRMIDDPLFRGVTDDSARLLANALFFGGVLDATSARDDASGDAGQASQQSHDAH